MGTLTKVLKGFSLSQNTNELEDELVELNKEVENSLFRREEFFKAHPEMIPNTRRSRVE